MSRSRVLSVGQCGFDHHGIAGMLVRHFDAEVVAAPTAADARGRLAREPFDLVLVNRVGDRDGLPGVDLIRAMKADPATADVPVMLVSNYPEAQAEAVALGALPGFGKSALGEPEVRDRLARALGLVPDHPAGESGD